MASDIEELADQFELGPKFYVLGFSMGGEVVWSCLKYIPHRYHLPKLLLVIMHVLVWLRKNVDKLRKVLF